MFPLFTIRDPLVDTCSVTVLVVGGMSWQRVLAYNALFHLSAWKSVLDAHGGKADMDCLVFGHEERGTWVNGLWHGFCYLQVK